MKRTFRRVLSFILTLALLCGLSSFALAANGGSAWEGHWSADYVRTALANGWITPDAEGEVAVKESLTRAEYAVILWRALGCPDPKGAPAFADVEGATEIAATTALNEMGILLGVGGKNFKPNGTLTREDGITILARAYKLTAEDYAAAESFDDWANVSEHARGAVAAAVEKGIVNGIGKNRLAPKNSITLGEMSKLTVVAAGTPASAVSADDAIVGVKAIGFVDVDCAKVQAIAVEYNVNLTGAALGAGSFEVSNYAIGKNCDVGSDPGVPLKAYVNDKAEISETGGSGAGKYVIIELNTDYILSGNPSKYTQSMVVKVLQTNAIRTANGVIMPGTEVVTNSRQVQATRPDGVPQTNPDGTPRMTDAVKPDGYIFTDGAANYDLYTREDGTAFHATNVFSQMTGERTDYDLPYALYVPDNYKAGANQKFALAVQVHAGSYTGTDPMLTVTGSKGLAVLASDEAQKIVKDTHGLDGLIVLAPQIATQDAHDNWAFDASLEAVWQLIDDIVETYPIDTDHIYGTGMSMGGIYVVAMAAQRDNFFAGIWANGAQFGNNYNLGDLEYDKVYPWYDYPADDKLIWRVDADGNEVDYRNWYYLISDDNFLITNATGDAFSTHMWNELKFLYSDLVGVEIPNVELKPYEDSIADQNAKINEMFKGGSATGFYWTTYVGGSHPETWKFSQRIDAQYQWLLTQDRQTEMNRAKLDLNKPFALAEKQEQTDARYIMDDADGNPVYYVTGARGSGTADYNSTIYAMGGNGIIKVPNWKPDSK